MGKLKFTFTNIFLWLGVIASALLIENVAFLTKNPTGVLSDKYFYMIFAVGILAFIGLFILEHKMNKTGVDFFLLAVLGTFLGAGLVAIWLYKDTTFVYPDASEHLLAYNVSERVRLSLSLFMFVLTVYSLLFIFSKNTVTGRKIIWVFVILILVGYASIIYSLIKELPQYRSLFTGENIAISVKSFFWNSNMFAGNLVMCICAAMIINAYKKNAFSVISIAIFAIFILMTCSLTSIIIALTLSLIYFLTDIVFLHKKHQVMSFVFLTVFLLMLVAIVCIYALALDGKMGSLSYFFIRIHKEITNTNYETFSNRIFIWNGAYGLLKEDPLKLAFGYGFGISKDFIREWSLSNGRGAIASTHNGAIQIFFNFGITGLVVYGLFLFYFFYAAVRLFKKNKYFVIMFLLSAVALLGYSIGESVIFFNNNVQGILVGTIFYLPLLMRYKHEKKQSILVSIKSTPYSWRTMEDSLLVKGVAIVIISLACALIPFLFLDSIKGRQPYYNMLLTIIICLGVLWLLFPYIVYLWHKDTCLIHFRIRAIVNSIIMIGAIGVVALFYFLFRRGLNFHYLYLFPIATATICLIEIFYYSIIKKPSAKAFLATFIALIKTSIIGSVVTVGTALLVFYFYQSQFDQGILKYAIIFVFNLTIFYVFTTVIMFKDMRGIVSYLDQLEINRIHRAVLKNEEGVAL